MVWRSCLTWSGRVVRAGSVSSAKRASCRFIQRYRSGFPENLSEEFDSPFVRLDWVSRDRFDIQWHRHTGAWHCLYRGLSLAEALNTIQSNGILHPV